MINPTLIFLSLSTIYFALLQDGVLSDDTSPSPFLPSPSLKLPLANSSLPGQGLGQGNPGLAMQNLNNRQQVTHRAHTVAVHVVTEINLSWGKITETLESITQSR